MVPTESPWRGGFGKLFVADGISTFGTMMSTLAIQFLLLDNLHADQTAIGIVRGAQWAPYLLLGLVAGVVVERLRRRPMLIACDLAQLVISGTIATLALTDVLTVPMLVGLVFCAGAVTCFSVAGLQSYLPRLVATHELPWAFTRLGQLAATNYAAAPLAAGSLVRFLSAPLAVLVDAATYAVSALALLSIRTPEPPPAPAADRHLVHELREGAAWVYRHP